MNTKDMTMNTKGMTMNTKGMTTNMKDMSMRDMSMKSKTSTPAEAMKSFCHRQKRKQPEWQ